MVTLSKKSRKSILRTGSLRKYFFYAIGEIALVVIGILIALQINNWNQERIGQKIERQLLQELIENLQTNEERFLASIADEKITARSIEYVVKSLENQWPYHDSMDYHYGRADFAADMVLTTTAFETIKSKGFDVVLDNNIRKTMIDLFDAEYGSLLASTIRLEDQFWPTASLPAFHRHFRIKNMRHGEHENNFEASPVNYDALKADDQYLNMIKHRGSFRYLSIDLKNKALQKTTDLKDMIVDYLKD